MYWYSIRFHRTSRGLRAGINTLDAPTERHQGREVSAIPTTDIESTPIANRRWNLPGIPGDTLQEQAVIKGTLYELGWKSSM